LSFVADYLDFSDVFDVILDFFGVYQD